jgi:hypothetical protein
MFRFVKGEAAVIGAILELMRIIIIILLLGPLCVYGLATIYSKIGIYDDKYDWNLLLGALFLIFVLYRNKLQFSGWYTGKGRQKLSKWATLIFIIVSALFVLSPVLFHFRIALTSMTAN